MQPNPVHFLHSLLRWMGGQAGLTYLTKPRSLWLGQAIEADSSAVWTVAQHYPGPGLFATELQRLNVQFLTTGEFTAASAQAVKVLGALCGPDGRPIGSASGEPSVLLGGPAGAGGVTFGAYELSDVAGGGDSLIGSYLLSTVRINSTPGVIGRDEKQRANFVFNVNLTYQLVD